MGKGARGKAGMRAAADPAAPSIISSICGMAGPEKISSKILCIWEVIICSAPNTSLAASEISGANMSPKLKPLCHMP